MSERSGSASEGEAGASQEQGRRNVIEQAQVERLARVLEVLVEVLTTDRHAELLEPTITAEGRRRIAEAWKGVTLAPSPRAESPLEAAVRKWRSAGWRRRPPDKEAMRESLAAAVGALGTYDIRDALAGALGDVPGAYYAENFRAALLAALTRNGEEAC